MTNVTDIVTAQPSPLVGISGRRKTAAIMGAPAGFADAPLELYLSEYATSVLAAGGLPVHLPLDAPPAELVARMDAVVVVGGDDVDPRRYGEAPGPFTTYVDPERDEFESALIEAAIDRGVPLLGVCRGAQLLNVVLGGALIQHLPTGEGESHGSYAYPRAHRSHPVSTLPGSLAAKLYGATARVNSFHHQAVGRLGDGLVATATAPDGIVEAIELTDADVVGVQWHPETFGGDPVFGWLVETAAQRAQKIGKAA
ncbi:gamma-glutamyl-gamma-aminobutyrate hydrolase family protein [Agromyces aerolatus]|uniref:gamma-glutamyl-gamma-aminobutyrate hydrolase family protein n=1 Tax=Agromyces sp. LY-1074 TaxID=3074080 RepID=UPI00286692A3|nr:MULTISPECIES: gamma-glutamyl-gamma-aminobutyrate hydrolase family protein [unclassified Agromyces]MDR5700430.1 gamma-glutamyl-gamma-aminobutyrate hydrolase family protein [Agromyces sp. LY-1074]MDR5706951.1 gamma-glutamyl-gamma-aminobutyrate hydrolase family protein [Agromyces sp. LY-1358]